MIPARCPQGRKDVTLRKLDIKVETVNREPLTLHADREEDTASVSTATRVMKAIYSVRATPRRGRGSPCSTPPRSGTGRSGGEPAPLRLRLSRSRSRTTWT